MIEIEKPRIETAVLSEDGRYGKLNLLKEVSVSHSVTQ